MTGLSGNELYCLQMKALRPGDLVLGNSVHSMGFLTRSCVSPHGHGTLTREHAASATRQLDA